MQDHPQIETGRLILAPLALAHAAALQRLYTDPRSMRFWHTAPHRSLDDTQGLVASLVDGPAHAWVLQLRAGGEAIGLVYYLGEGHAGSRGLGYILAADHWRQGLMSEAVRAVIDHGFSAWDMDRIELWIDARNIASQALAAGVGLVRQGAFRQCFAHETVSQETHVFGLTIEQWRPGASPRHRPPIETYGMLPVLTVADVGASADHYRDRLGFDIAFIIGEPPVYAIMSLGLWSVGGARIAFAAAETPDQPLSQGVVLSLDVGPAIDALHDLYRERGVTIVEAPTTRPWGRREFAIRDGDGHVLRFGTAVPQNG
jgi:RimJ/RimL family protein N-acetyltransferase/uncharacterized glyoxalase superfamily protein PhnB